MLRTRLPNRLRNFSLADSRFASLRYISNARWPITRNLTTLALLILGSILFVHYFSPAGLDPTARNALFILILATSLWVTEAVPPFAVSFIIMGLSVFFLESLAPLELSEGWEQYVNTWSSPVIWILLGGFMLALGAQVTGFDRRFSSVVIRRFGTSPYRLLLGIMLTTGVLSMFISNTATTAMMLAILMPFAKKYGRDEPIVKAMLLGVAAAATLGGMGTVIGSSPNAIALGILHSAGYNLTFIDWMIPGIPTAFTLILISWYMLKRIYRTNLTELELNEMDEQLPMEYTRRNTTENRVIVVLTFLLTVGLWMTSTLHHIPVAAVSLIPIVFFTATGIVESSEIKLIPWDTLILVSGGLTLGVAISESGLATWLITLLPAFQNPLLVILLVAFLTSLVSNVMSNTAAASILIPLGAILVPVQFVPLMVVTLGFAASTALLLPISTPPNALVFSTRFLNQSDYHLPGLVITFISPFLILTVLWFFFR